MNAQKKSYELCLKIYRITAKFPKDELGTAKKDIAEIERMLKADNIFTKQTLASF